MAEERWLMDELGVPFLCFCLLSSVHFSKHPETRETRFDPKTVGRTDSSGSLFVRVDPFFFVGAKLSRVSSRLGWKKRGLQGVFLLPRALETSGGLDPAELGRHAFVKTR